MSLDKAVERGNESSAPMSTAVAAVTNGNGNGTGAAPSNASYRLRLNPNQDHKAENYDDLGMEFTPLLFSSLERYLPPNLLNASRDTKYKYMRDILRRYSTEGERTRVSICIKHRFMLHCLHKFEFSVDDEQLICFQD